MENAKKCYLPEETLRTQRVEIYLQDLKERLHQLRRQHDAVIHNSEEIIHEIGQVSSSLSLTENCSSAGPSDERMTKIRKLILEFETAKENYCPATIVTPEITHVDIRQILQNFERLSDSQLLQDSLLLFRKAKESLDKIDTLLGNGKEINNDLKTYNLNESVRHKISMFSQNKKQLQSEMLNVGKTIQPSYPPIAVNTFDAVQTDISLDIRDTISNYASCCSSLESIQQYQYQDFLENESIGKNSLNGYEGDNDDSEFDMLSAKRK